VKDLSQHFLKLRHHAEQRNERVGRRASKEVMLLGSLLRIHNQGRCVPTAGTNYRWLSRTPGFRPSVNSKPAASSTCRRLSTVRLRSFSPRSKRTTVSGDTLAAAANFLALKPMAALAMRHCTGSTCSEPLFSVPGSVMPHRDCSGDESASADHLEDQ
jgi:hypothetical protein